MFQSSILNTLKYTPSNIINDGQFHRFSTQNDNPKDTAGYYLLKPDNSYGCYGDHRAGIYEIWFPNDSNYSEIDRELYRREAKLLHDKECERSHNAIAIKAQELWDKSTNASNHPYLNKKQITGDGLRIDNNLLLAPLIDIENKLWNIEKIHANGDKRGLTGGRRKGVFFKLGNIENNIFICEGIATAKSIYQATGISTIASCGVNNLENVIENIVKKYSELNIIICADDDYKSNLNVGIETSKKVAAKFNLKMVYPIFKNELNRGTDFNDLHCIEGISTVENQLKDLFKNINWRNELKVKINNDGVQKILCRVHNIALILNNENEFRTLLQYNEFSEKILFKGEALNDKHLAYLRATLENKYIFDKVSKDDINDAIILVAHKNTVHPVRDYLNSIKWDGRKRIYTFIPDYLKVEYSEYNQDVSKFLFMSAVNRIMNPGCKCDGMVILEGKQGIGKSRTWSTLGGDYYADIATDMNDKDFSIGLHGVWFADLGELDQFTRADVSRIKKMLTIQTDYVRLPYGRSHQHLPRQNIFVGGTNRNDWLNDPTGGRRFYPIACPNNKIDIDAIARVRDQLWAEAIFYYKEYANNVWWEVRGAEEQQNNRYQDDVWTETIANFMLTRQEVSTTEILSRCLNIDISKQNKSDQMRVATILQRMGFKHKRKQVGNVRVYVFSKID